MTISFSPDTIDCAIMCIYVEMCGVCCMLSEERHEKILDMIQTKSYVKVSELMKAFDVSIETVRRDLFFLESRGLLKRIHGGATASKKIPEFQDISHRVHIQSEQKKCLANMAVSLIREQDIIAIDSGSTAIEFAEAIRNSLHDLTVVTHSMSVFEILGHNAGIKLILIGGQYLTSEDAFYGPLAENQLRNLRVSKSFVFPSGVSLKDGITDFVVELIPIQKAYLEIAGQPFVMADSSKFETSAFVKICDINANQVYITDDKLSDEIYEMYIQKSVNIYRGETPDESASAGC